VFAWILLDDSKTYVPIRIKFLEKQRVTQKRNNYNYILVAENRNPYPRTFKGIKKLIYVAASFMVELWDFWQLLVVLSTGQYNASLALLVILTWGIRYLRSRSIRSVLVSRMSIMRRCLTSLWLQSTTRYFTASRRRQPTAHETTRDISWEYHKL